MRTYAEIQGWFSEEWLYDRMVEQASDGALFVEVGCWLGKSTVYLAHRIKESGKNIRVHAVDTWKGSANEENMVDFVAKAGGTVFHLFMENLRAAEVENSVWPMRMTSADAARIADEGSADFIFIDADHTREAVMADILAWRPKLKAGGVMAGHDWNTYASVQEAVKATLGPDGFVVEGNCWVVET